MSTPNKWTGKPMDNRSDTLPSESKQSCEVHAGAPLIQDCWQCGAPMCCPVCCDEATREASP